jgi:hypothetical protein
MDDRVAKELADFLGAAYILTLALAVWVVVEIVQKIAG